MKFVAVPLLAGCLLPMAALAGPAVEVNTEVHHDTSGALRDMKITQPTSRLLHTLPLRHTGPLLPYEAAIGDVASQFTPGPELSARPGLNLVGVGTGFTGPQGTFTDSSAPPDVNGAVGTTQVVEWVNQSFAVFDKVTGKPVLGPAQGNTLWKGFGGGCETNNDGDIIVLFDKAAQRWVFTQFSISNTPYLQCVAVSTTSDATGSFNRYSFTQPNFNDYPKLGTWSDAYYMSFNIFGAAFLGPRACAFDRAKMLTGVAAKQECFQLGTNYGSLLPADLDGSTPPPAGSPNYYVSYTNNALQMWSFHADFITPKNATFTGPVTIPVAAFTPACGGGTCVPQKGTTQQLDTLADRLMYRLAYRNYSAANPPHESLVVTHSVKPAAPDKGVSAVRWYELRSPGTSPVLFQQGTYAPAGSTSRWMGSAAMDKIGDMLVGYSASSATLYPEIFVAGRKPTEALGTLEAEHLEFAGSGAQSGGLSRWGDYTAMSVDPVDDCTFWYFGEYIPANGSFNWSTRIGSYKFPACK